ncbi:uncharacterized protein LOC111048357 [Nilaparvata lugens]|uniref:uncharacterized protein LOC111048357 n=1 Tax=Nilaparvata lugens TaxID=108931 RepID=UPI00193D72CB|nr:uncharacterized protein LOC111048357 [Nilaparvata lugens]
MGRAVLCEEKLLGDLIKLSKTHEFTSGLILGQSSGTKDFVIHLARTPLQLSNESDVRDNSTPRESSRALNNVTDIVEKELVEHAKQVENYNNIDFYYNLAYSDYINLSSKCNFLVTTIRPTSFFQSSGTKDFVIHLARTPLQLSNESDVRDNSTPRESSRALNNVTDIVEKELVEHAKQVTWMLPGGMWILGVFTIGPGDLFSDALAQSELKSVLTKLSKCLSVDNYKYGNSPSTEKLAFHLNSESKKYCCRGLDLCQPQASQTFRPVDWKFQSNCTKWLQLDCHFDFEQLSPYIITDSNSALMIKKHLKEILDQASIMVSKAVCTIDGEIRNGTDSLEVTDKKKKGKSSGNKSSKEEKTFEVNLYFQNVSPENCFKERYQEYSPINVFEGFSRYGGPIECPMQNCCRRPTKSPCTLPSGGGSGDGWIAHTLRRRRPPADIQRKALQWNPAGRRRRGRPRDTWRRGVPKELKDAGKEWREMKVLAQNRAIKEDIMRSLSSRLEMHWDTLVDDEVGSPDERVVLHEPPRRVLIPLPYCKVALSDYLFPGEDASETLDSLQLLLGLKLAESSLLKDFEGQSDPNQFYELTRNASLSGDNGSQKPTFNSQLIISGMIIAALVMLISIFIQLSGWPRS